MKIPIGNGQLSLVALFGDKKQHYPELWSLLQELQSVIETSLGKENFRRYEEFRVHATIVGLEGYRDDEHIWSKTCYETLKIHRAMDIAGLLEFLLNEHSPFLPLSIQVGGFKESVVYPFRSRGHAPYFRSFSIQNEIAVTMGWPVQNNSYISGMDRLRRSFNQFNVVHKYHNSDQAYDNDFFFVLGNVTPGLSGEVVNACQDQMRKILACNDLPPIKITQDQLKIIAYPEGDTQFERAVASNLEEAKAQIDKLKNFYTTMECNK